MVGAVGVALGAFVGAGVVMHPFHSSLIQAELDEETGLVEVSMRVDARSFGRALSFWVDEEVDLEDVARVAEVAPGYLGAGWRWREPGAEEPEDGWPGSEVVWVGMEESGERAWLYYTVAGPWVGAEDAGPIDSYELSVSVFFEREPEQEHAMTLRYGEALWAWVFSAEHAWARVGVVPEDGD